MKNCNNSISEESLIRLRPVRNARRQRKTHLSLTSKNSSMFTKVPPKNRKFDGDSISRYIFFTFFYFSRYLTEELR